MPQIIFFVLDVDGGILLHETMSLAGGISIRTFFHFLIVCRIIRLFFQDGNRYFYTDF